MCADGADASKASHLSRHKVVYIYICVCVCMYMSVYVCMYMSVYVCMYMYVCIKFCYTLYMQVIRFMCADGADASKASHMPRQDVIYIYIMCVYVCMYMYVCMYKDLPHTLHTGHQIYVCGRVKGVPHAKPQGKPQV
jgi:hypothetical protein